MNIGTEREFLKTWLKLSVVAHNCNPSTWGVGGESQVRDMPGLLNKTLLPSNKSKQEKKNLSKQISKKQTNP